jgi:hypothetical protein
MLASLLNKKGDLSVSSGVLLYKQLIHLMIDYACPHEGSLPASTFGSYKCCNPSVFALLLVLPGT